jgi:deoxyribonuclease-4
MGNAMHYTQIKKSDLNFEPLAEFIIEEGAWLDMTLISDSPLLEHDAMYMVQNIERARHRQLERKAREDRRKALAAQANITPEEMEAREIQVAEARAKDALANVQPAPAEKEETVEEKTAEPEKKEEAVEEKTVESDKKPAKKATKKEENNDDLFAVEEDDDDIF